MVCASGPTVPAVTTCEICVVRHSAVPFAPPPLCWQVLLALVLLGWKEGVSPVLRPACPQNRVKTSKVGRLGTRRTFPLFPALSVTARLWASPSPSLGLCSPTWEKREEPWASLQILEHQYSVAMAPLPTTLSLADTALVLPTPRPHTRALCV